MMPARQARARGALRTSPGPDARGSSAKLVIPFDHAASFELTGVPGNIIQDVINISTDGVFIATSIGYGFEEDRARRLQLTQSGGGLSVIPGRIPLLRVPTEGLIDGFRLNPGFEQVVFEPEDPSLRAARGFPRERVFSTRSIEAAFEGDILQGLKPREEISFLFSIVDTATGRELQDEPTHNLASLGKSNGERPFRQLAQPLTFQPRSTLRLQIIERSEGVRGTLFIVLYGYKVLATACPEPVARSIRGSPECPVETIGSPSDRVIPFDYVASFQLTGSPGNQVEAEVPVNVEGGFVATSIGYGLAVENLDVKLKEDNLTITPINNQPTVRLTDLQLRDFPTSALQDGIRVRPGFVRIAFNNGTLTPNDLPLDLVNRLFERVNRPENVSFRYSIFDSATGRELQNQPINNIAGLGIEDGDRPFKRFARPMLFLPRSTIRITVDERFGRGTLFMVFQGYKILSALRGVAPPPLSSGRRPTRR